MKIAICRKTTEAFSFLTAACRIRKQHYNLPGSVSSSLKLQLTSAYGVAMPGSRFKNIHNSTVNNHKTYQEKTENKSSFSYKREAVINPM